jgi:hypothetical protein
LEIEDEEEDNLQKELDILKEAKDCPNIGTCALLSYLMIF